MSVADQLKTRAMAAMKAKNVVEKEVLRVALGEIQVVEARTGNITDDEAFAIIRKLVKSNQETLALAASDEQKHVLTQEIAILELLLPKSLSVEDIVASLKPIAEEIRAAKSAGQATGVAMKHLKAANATVNGKDVASAVQQLRE
jgi:uncharacterized protein YqeY